MENSKIQFPTLPKDEYFYISPEGLSRIGNIYDKNEPLKHVIWTNDYTVELPIPMKKEGPGSERPITLIEALESSVSKFPKNKAMAVKKDNQWKTWTYEELYSDVRNFASALISLGINNYKALNIIGFNDPAWFISFFGCIFANVLPVGVYTTNGPEACKYVAEHSEAEIVVVENKAHLKKYLQVWDELPRLKYIVVYKDTVPADIPEKRRSQVMTFEDLLKIGVQFAKESKNEVLQARKERQKPGNCCTLVYTSGTTGLPKAVMLSHDNYTWLGSIFYKQYDHLMPVPKADGTFEEELRVVSYLPLSHVAAQFTEMIVPLTVGASVYFALPTALQGSLIETLKEVRPVFLLSVPRLWEKIEETLKNMAKSNGFVKKSLADWAKGMGLEGTLAEQEGKPTPFGWGVAKTIVYNNVKKALGIDNCRLLLYGAAPLSHNTRTYFSTLNIFLINVYGMSENAGPETYYAPFKGVPANIKSAGLGLPGTTIAIYNPDKDGDGEICFRGRNRFMGYYKDDENTKQVIDEKGFLHSGDVGHIGKNGHLFITGRLKELIITAGGENIAPVLIENEIKAAVPEISQCVVIGENRKYLSVLITLKHEVQGEGLPGENLDKFVLAELKNQGVAATKIKDLRTDPNFVKYIEAGLAKANNKAISRAHNVRKWYLLESDFSTASGEMTPTMKLKRKVVSTKFAKEIETMYEEPKL